jgi:DNA-binding transcriptional LysR family regulator
MLIDHRLDFCIADLNADETNLTYLPLYKEEFCAAVSPSYYEDDTAAVSQLPQMNLLLREEGSGSRLCLQAVASRRSLELSPYAECGSDLSLIRMAENGLGLTVVPKRLIEKSIRKKRLHTVKIKGADFRRQYYLIYRTDMYLDDSLQSLVRSIRTFAKKGLDS